jgi:hypothetical protein
MPLFSIIAVHYQGTISRETYLRGINSILSQTFKDYELLVYHDGPPLDPQAPTPVPIRCTAARHNDWGHSLRDRGIREASGDYILHFNVDNILYPSALEMIAQEIRRPSRVYDTDHNPLDTDNIIIFPIIMNDHDRVMPGVVRIPGSGARLIMTGNPPFFGAVDCMQLVMKRSLWLAEGGWSDKRQQGDGVMYQSFGEKYGYRGVGAILGEHF